tara:strand:+ start:2760 stop:4295 length:1536 start_codon:yes stop_codon:yes gene_type:complete
MALPIVTYGKYNYGQYANPAPIRYKGGFGEALTGVATAISTAEKKKKAQFKEAQETSLMMSMQFNSQLNTAFGKASATNRKFLRDLKQEYGDTVKSYKLGNLSFDDYEDKMTYYQNILDESMQLAGIMKPIIESDTDVTFDMARSDDDNQAATLARHGVRKGLYILERDENGLRVVLPHGPSASNYEPKSIAASELITNTKYINPQLKYDNMRNEKYGVMLGKVADNLKNKSALLTSRIEKDLGAKVFSLDSNSKDAIINEIMKREDLLNIFNDNEEKEIYYEDEIGGLGSWNGNEDQLKAIKLQLANNIYDSLLGKDISATKYVPESELIIDPRTGQPFGSKTEITNYNKEQVLKNKRQDFFDKNLLEIYFAPRQGSYSKEDTYKSGRKQKTIKSFTSDFLNRLQELEGVESDLRPFEIDTPNGKEMQIEITASSQFEQQYDQGKGKVRIGPNMTENEIVYAIGSALGFSRSEIQKRIEEIRKQNPAKTVYSPERLQGITNLIEGLPTNK